MEATNQIMSQITELSELWVNFKVRMQRLLLCAVQTGDEHEQTGRKRRTKRTKESSHKKKC